MKLRILDFFRRFYTLCHALLFYAHSIFMCVYRLCAFFVAFETYFSHCCFCALPFKKVFAALWSHSEKNYIPHAVAPLIMMIIIRTDCEKPY